MNDDNKRGSRFGNVEEVIPGEDDVDSIMRSLESWAPPVQMPLNPTTHEDLGWLKSSGVVEEHRDVSHTSRSNTVLLERDLSQGETNQPRGTIAQKVLEEPSKVEDPSTGTCEDSEGVGRGSSDGQRSSDEQKSSDGQRSSVGKRPSNEQRSSDGQRSSDEQRSSVGNSRTSRDQLPLSVATLSRLFQCNSGYASSNGRDRESHLPKSHVW